MITLLPVFIGHEARIQARSMAFRFAAACYVVLTCLPPVLKYLSSGSSSVFIGPTSYTVELMRVQPFLTAVLAAVVSVNALNREREEGSLAVVGLLPVSNAGYLLLRWAAVVAVVVPVTLIPVAVTVWISATEAAAPLALAFLWSWLFHIVPVCLGTCALALGLGTITGGSLTALVVGYLLLQLLFGIADSVLERLGLNLVPPSDWIATFEATHFMQISWLHLASEGAYDTVEAARRFLILGRLHLGVSALIFGLAVMYLRRSRPDVRPWHISDRTPLPTFMRTANRARLHYSPDPWLSSRDYVLLVAGVLAFVGTVALAAGRGEHFLQLATERYRVEQSGAPEPMSANVVPRSVNIAGSIDRRGDAQLSVVTEMHNTGADAQTHLAFSLNPLLVVESVTSDTGSVSSQRHYDRLTLGVDPPLASGQTRRLEFTLRGQPGEAHTGLPEMSSLSFRESYENWAPDHDFSQTWVEPAVSRRRIDLEAEHLAPVPRYAPWKLTPRPEIMGQAGEQVPEETFHPTTQVEIDLALPAGWFAADTCGHRLQPDENGRARLRGRCMTSLQGLAILGGDLAVLPKVPGMGQLVVVRGHEALADYHGPSFVEAVRLARDAWPESGGSDPVLVEWPPAFDLDLTRGMPTRWTSAGNIETRGALTIIPEGRFTRKDVLNPEALAGEMVASDLISRRPVPTEESFAFYRLFRWVAWVRLGRPTPGAVIEGRGRMHGDAKRPLLEATRWNAVAWELKLPALLTDVRNRMGSEGLMAAIREFLDAPEGPYTLARLWALIAARSEEPIDTMYADYVVGSALPELTLVDVSFRRRATDWEVTGTVKNLGDGRTTCSVVLGTDVAQAEATIRTGDGSLTPFRIRSPYRPRSVSIDPRGRCYRYRSKPRGEVVERIDFGGDT